MPAEAVVEHAGYWFMVYIRNKTVCFPLLYDRRLNNGGGSIYREYLWLCD